FLPRLNALEQAEALTLELLSLVDSFTDISRDGPSARPVVRRVPSLLAGLTISVIEICPVDLSRGLGTKISSFAKDLLHYRVISVPCHYLCVGPLEVDFDYCMIRVWDNP